MITRTLLVTGPAKIVRGGGIIYTQDDVAINIIQTTTPIGSMAHGHINERADSVTVEATFTPEGRWDALTRAFLWPYLATIPGTSLFGASDTPTLFHGSDGGLAIIHASAVMQMPSIFLSAAKTMIGPMTIGGVRKNGVDWSTADSLVSCEPAGGTFADTTFTAAMIKVQDYTGAYIGTGLTAIKTEDGWTIDFNVESDPVRTDDGGILDYRYRTLQVVARCIPTNPLPSELIAGLTVQGAGAIRGRSLGVLASEDLVITGADGTIPVTLKDAGMRTAGFRFGVSVLRTGETGFVASRPFTTGAMANICVLA